MLKASVTAIWAVPTRMSSCWWASLMSVLRSWGCGSPCATGTRRIHEQTQVLSYSLFPRPHPSLSRLTGTTQINHTHTHTQSHTERTSALCRRQRGLWNNNHHLGPGRSCMNGRPGNTGAFYRLCPDFESQRFWAQPCLHITGGRGRFLHVHPNTPTDDSITNNLYAPWSVPLVSLA